MESAMAIEGNVFVGWSQVDITPIEPVRLRGQFYERVSTSVQSSLQVSVLAIETRDDTGESIDQLMIGACDLVGVGEPLQQEIRAELDDRVTGFDLQKLFLNATHTHTGPYLADSDGLRQGIEDYVSPDIYPEKTETDGSIMTGDEYRKFLVGRLCEAFLEAWDTRTTGTVSWQLGHAVTSHNRRSVYDDGSALMYGPTAGANYSGPEGPEDHGVELLYFWNSAGELTGTAVNIASPAQVLEHKRVVSSDYWGITRRILKDRLGEALHVLPLCGAAGDQSPRDLVRNGRGEPDMFDIKGAEEIGKRVADVITSRLAAAELDRTGRLVLDHRVMNFDLPVRTVSQSQVDSAKAELQRLLADKKPGEKLLADDMPKLFQPAGIIARHEYQHRVHFYSPEVHLVRLGDIAIATNPFELFTLYGLRMKARSKAYQTFIVQLACDTGGYLPTEKAVQGGHYSAVVGSGKVGPDGGQILVDRTVETLNSMWE